MSGISEIEALRCARIEMTGNRELYVENYKKITGYSEESVALETVSGKIKVSGTDMVIREIGAGWLKICGRFRSVEFT